MIFFTTNVNNDDQFGEDDKGYQQLFDSWQV